MHIGVSVEDDTYREWCMLLTILSAGQNGDVTSVAHRVGAKCDQALV